MNYLEGLNEQQRAAVLHQGTPLLILAGAGSGKTRVITTRIIHQIEQYIATPRQLLAMTFTNKAAREMKSRIEAYFGDHMDLTITTFHSFCARFLRREIGYLERETNFAIFDSQDQLGAIKQILKESRINDKKEPPVKLRAIFSRVKNSGDMEAEPEDSFYASLFRDYNRLLARQNALDFDDLILFTGHILNTFEDCRERTQHRYQHLLIDEFQDTNKAQFALLRLLTPENPDLCVVGDEDQSIYGWRGADIHNILDFKETYPNTETFKLEQNYRSTQAILDFSNRVISKNTSRYSKQLWTEVKDGEQVRVVPTASEREEALFAAQYISSKVSPDAYGECAILFRANYLTRSFEEVFRSRGIPYQLVGGVRFYDRKEIKDLLAYARLVVNPKDWTSCCRAMGVPSRSLGAKTLEKLTPYFVTHGTCLEGLEAALKDNVLRATQANGLTAFVALMRQLEDAAKELGPASWLTELIRILDYRTHLEQEDEVTAEFRAQNIDELLSAMAELERQGMASIAQFLDHTALISDQDQWDDQVEKINLMTVHAAKGLEFNTVIVAGLEDGVFPNQRSLDESAMAIEEERRLFYVAATRARRALILTHAQYRQIYGSRTRAMPSRFLREARQSQPVTDQRTRIGDLGVQLELIEQKLAQQSVDIQFRPELKKPRYRIGDIVEHATFGAGRIVSFSGKGAAAKVSIYFQGKGTKLFYLDRVPLKKRD